jgi:hypothetical protein
MNYGRQAQYFLWKLKPTSILFQMEDDLYFVLGNLGNWFLVCNIVSTQLNEIWNTTSFFFKLKPTSIFWKMEDDLIFFQWKMTSNIWKEKTTLSFENGIQPLFFKWKMTSILWKWKTTFILFWNGRRPPFFWKWRTTLFL